MCTRAPTPHRGYRQQAWAATVQGRPKRFAALVPMASHKEGDPMSGLAGAFPILWATRPLSRNCFSTWSLTLWACLSLWVVVCGLYCQLGHRQHRKEGRRERLP